MYKIKIHLSKKKISIYKIYTMSEITLNSVTSGSNNLLVNFTDANLGDATEYIAFIINSGSVQTVTFYGSQTTATLSVPITYNMNITTGVAAGVTYTVQIAKNNSDDVGVGNTSNQVVCTVCALPDTATPSIDQSGNNLFLNWAPPAVNGSAITSYNIYGYALNTNTNAFINANKLTYDMPVPVEPKVKYTPSNYVLNSNGSYSQNPWGTYKKNTYADYLHEAYDANNPSSHIYITGSANSGFDLSDYSGNQIVDISGNLYDADGVALKDFSGNTIDMTDNYVIFPTGQQLLADENLNAIGVANGNYNKHPTTGVYSLAKYGLYIKIEDSNYTKTDTTGASSITCSGINGTNNVSVTPVDLPVYMHDLNGLLADADGNVVFDVSGNVVKNLWGSKKLDASGNKKLCLTKNYAFSNGSYTNVTNDVTDSLINYPGSKLAYISRKTSGLCICSWIS
jgi:hypothetical protein